MPSSLPSLAQLRQEIDSIDDALHDLIMRRAAVVGEIRQLKPTDRPAIRPAREAAILRRLLARHSGGFPKIGIIRLWQTMFGAFVGLQGGFTIAGPAALQPLARDGFGGFAKYVIAPSDTAIVEVAQGNATLAMVPVASDAWWVTLAQPGMPKVIGRLPFLATGDAASAFLVARLEPEPSGSDRSLIVVSGNVPVPFEHTHILQSHGDLRLLEVDGFVAVDDSRLGKVLGLTLIGAYPAPYESILL